MNIEELRNEYTRLTHCPTIKDSVDAINIYANFMLQTVKHHHSRSEEMIAVQEGRIVNQMMLTKVLHIKQALEGLEFLASDGTQLIDILDPTVIASLIRNVYETVGMFNLIYVHPVSSEQRIILYNLWVIAGLKYRQKFGKVARSPESIKKFVEENKQIELYKNEIEQTSLFGRLSDKDKKKVLDKINEKDYKIKFIGDSIVFQSWQTLISTMGIKEGWADECYTYFSLYAHPSNVSVFQFGNLFHEESKQFVMMTNFNLKYLFMFLSVFIADYIKVYPEVKITFEKQPLISQLVINGKNVYVRGEEFSINDCLIALGYR